MNALTNIQAVIISRNQSQSLEKMYKSLISSGIHDMIFVLDRCSDNSECVLKGLGVKYVKTPFFWLGRKTSSARNYGLKFCDNNKDILFVDGDRYIVKGDFSNIDNFTCDIGLLTIENDTRDLNKPYNDFYGQVNNNFYSCGLFIKNNALKKIKKFMNGCVFSKKLEKYWGCEDLYLGDVCYHLGLTCDYFLDVTLNGSFEKTTFDTIDIIKKRFKMRDKLNVIW